jgi:hypothetical protein
MNQITKKTSQSQESIPINITISRQHSSRRRKLLKEEWSQNNADTIKTTTTMTMDGKNE